MNKLLLTILMFTGTLLVISCDKESAGTINDFSNVVNPYAAFGADEVDIAEGETGEVEFVIRTAFSKPGEDVTITYDISGAITATDQTIIIPRGEVSAVLEIPISEGFITDPDPDATKEATVSIKKAVLSDGTVLRNGLKDDGAETTIVIYKPE